MTEIPLIVTLNNQFTLPYLIYFLFFIFLFLLVKISGNLDPLWRKFLDPRMGLGKRYFVLRLRGGRTKKKEGAERRNNNTSRRFVFQQHPVITKGLWLSIFATTKRNNEITQNRPSNKPDKMLSLEVSVNSELSDLAICFCVRPSCTLCGIEQVGPLQSDTEMIIFIKYS